MESVQNTHDRMSTCTWHPQTMIWMLHKLRMTTHSALTSALAKTYSNLRLAFKQKAVLPWSKTEVQIWTTVWNMLRTCPGATQWCREPFNWCGLRYWSVFWVNSGTSWWGNAPSGLISSKVCWCFWSQTRICDVIAIVSFLFLQQPRSTSQL